MKKSPLIHRFLRATSILLVCVFFVSKSFATIRTLSNAAFSPGQFTTFLAAHTACLPNDTIYVHGSSLTYGAITIFKQIVVIGPGHNPVKQAPFAAIFTTITATVPCTLNGLTFDSFNSTAINTTIKRCRILQPSGPTVGILGLGNATNWLIEGNVFTSSGLAANITLNGANNSNTTVSNNIFCTNMIAPSGGTTLNTFFITNNLFLGLVGLTLSVGQANINNNIFYRSSPQGTLAACVMNNNISFNCAINTFSAPGVNNLVNINPMFTSFPIAGAIFDYSHNYILAPGSPGLLNGTDGTDRGVFGGFGFKFNMTGEPAIAEITSFTITSPAVIAPGGTLNINVQSKRVR